MIDSTKMKTIIRNFISNALKFSSKGKQITVQLLMQDQFSLISDDQSNHIPPDTKILRFNVIDEGPGISKVCLIDFFNVFN